MVRVQFGIIAGLLLMLALASAARGGGAIEQTRAASATRIDGTADPARGKDLYQACSACHSADENDIGPKHRGVVGRRAASAADYPYSQALRDSGLTWDEATLDRWLTDPSALVPGTKMFFKLADPKIRADLIAYLKELR